MIVIDGEEDDHLEMLEGGVMRQLLDDKWKTFARVTQLLKHFIVHAYSVHSVIQAFMLHSCYKYLM